MEACWAHNPEVRGSKPRSASNSFINLKNVWRRLTFFYLVSSKQIKEKCVTGDRRGRTRPTKLLINYIRPCQRNGVREWKAKFLTWYSISIFGLMKPNFSKWFHMFLNEKRNELSNFSGILNVSARITFEHCSDVRANFALLLFNVFLSFPAQSIFELGSKKIWSVRTKIALIEKLFRK